MNKQQKIIFAACMFAAFASISFALVFRMQARAVTEAANRAIEMLEEENLALKKAAEAYAAAVQPVPVAVVAPAVAELQATVAAQAAELETLRTNAMIVTAVAPVADVAATNPPPERRSWMEDLQASDPERYKEILERREQARQAARYDIAKKAAHFLQRPPGDISEEEQNQYAYMMELLTDSLKLTEQLDAGLPNEDRREISRSLRENMRELSPLLEAERGKEFYQVGKDLGYSDADAEAFSAYLTEVIDLTSVSSIFRNAMRGGMGGWGGGGPPPDDRAPRP
jgi:hypothetical protein